MADLLSFRPAWAVGRPHGPTASKTVVLSSSSIPKPQVALVSPRGSVGEFQTRSTLLSPRLPYPSVWSPKERS